MPTAANDGSVPASAAGYTTVLASLNDFVGQAIDTLLSDTAKAAINWTKGDNSNLVPCLLYTSLTTGRISNGFRGRAEVCSAEAQGLCA